MKKLYIIILCLISFQAFALESNDYAIYDDVEESVVTQPDFEVYPNPAVGNNILVSLKGVTSKGDCSLTITNVIGQELFNYRITDSDIDRGSFKINLEDNDIRKGLYFIKLVVGSKTTIKKLMVK